MPLPGELVEGSREPSLVPRTEGLSSNREISKDDTETSKDISLAQAGLSGHTLGETSAASPNAREDPFPLETGLLVRLLRQVEVLPVVLTARALKVSVTTNPEASVAPEVTMDEILM